MTSAFIPEHQIYGYLSAVGIRTPRHYFVDHESKLADAPFADGDPVVIKGIARELWHKSDTGALEFCHFDREAVAATHSRMRERVERQYEWLGILIAWRIFGVIFRPIFMFSLNLLHPGVQYG